MKLASPKLTDPFYDVGAASSIGERENQEDSLAHAVSGTGGELCVVLADGMGGHAAGEVASNIVVATMVDHIVENVFDRSLADDEIYDYLNDAAESANRRISAYARMHPESRGMGSTLVAIVVRGTRIFWASVGDSLLYLLEEDGLHRLNADHSMGRQFDEMVRMGIMTREKAETHPDRSMLTSALIGGEIAKIDLGHCEMADPARAALLVASDGLETLSLDEIRATLAQQGRQPSLEVSHSLLRAVESKNEEYQDNTTVAIVKQIT